MVLTWPTEVELLKQLVGIPSVSGTEETIGEFVERTAESWGLDVTRSEHGVIVRVAASGGERGGNTLAFVSHLDTVPAGEGWNRSPFDPMIEGTRLYGRGSGDAKASVAAMLTAARETSRNAGELRGDLVLLLGYGEETKHTTMPHLIEAAGPITFAVVGEPTSLQAAIAQRGIMMVDLVARGDQRHAGYAGDETHEDAITRLAADLVKLPQLFTDRIHPVLGHATATATMLEAGVSRNVTPPVAKAVLDVRSTPSWTHGELHTVMEQQLTSEVIVTSDRLVPCETPAESVLLRAMRDVRPTLSSYGSPTCSDWVFLRHLDVVKCGPGTSRLSHTPDEHVDLHEVSEAVAFYHELAMELLR